MDWGGLQGTGEFLPDARGCGAALGYIEKYWFVLVYTSLHWSILVHTGLSPQLDPSQPYTFVPPPAPPIAPPYARACQLRRGGALRVQGAPRGDRGVQGASCEEQGGPSCEGMSVQQPLRGERSVQGATCEEQDRASCEGMSVQEPSCEMSVQGPSCQRSVQGASCEDSVQGSACETSVQGPLGEGMSVQGPECEELSRLSLLD